MVPDDGAETSVALLRELRALQKLGCPIDYVKGAGEKELATFTLSILLSAAILRFLWNRSLVKHVSALRPIESIPDALLLSIALATVRGACD